MTVITAVVFSGTLAVLGEVNTGLLSLTGVTLTLIVCVACPAAAVAGLHRHDVDVVAIGVGGCFEVRRRMNDSTPPAVIENLRLIRAARDRERHRLAGRSASVAVTVITAVVFSGTLAVSGDVNTGLLSLTGVTVTLIVRSGWRSVQAPSLAVTWTRYTLSPIGVGRSFIFWRPVTTSTPADVIEPRTRYRPEVIET